MKIAVGNARITIRWKAWDHIRGNLVNQVLDFAHVEIYLVETVWEYLREPVAEEIGEQVQRVKSQVIAGLRNYFTN